MEPIQLAPVLAVVILLAGMVSVELGITAALLELSLGVVAGTSFIYRRTNGSTSLLNSSHGLRVTLTRIGP